MPDGAVSILLKVPNASTSFKNIPFLISTSLRSSAKIELKRKKLKSIIPRNFLITKDILIVSYVCQEM